MNGFSIQQQLVALLTSTLRASALPLPRQVVYFQMLKALQEQPFPDEDETREAMSQLMDEVRAELQQA